MRTALTRTARRAVTKAIRTQQQAGNSRPIQALFYDHKGNVYRKIRYAFIDTAIPKIAGHVLWLAVMHRIELVHIETGFQIGVLKKSSTGKIQSSFCWEEAPKSVKTLLRPEG